MRDMAEKEMSDLQNNVRGANYFCPAMNGAALETGLSQ